MLAESIAVVVVSVAVLGPGSYLLHAAWVRGGTPRKFAVAVLLCMLALIAWLFAPAAPGTTTEERVSRFVGAWGVLFVMVGAGVGLAAALRKLRSRKRQVNKT